MQHDIVLKKFNFDPLTPRVSWVCRQNICYHVARFRHSNKFDMQHDHVLKRLNFDHKGQGVGVCRQNICYHVATVCDSNKYDVQHEHVL